MSTIIRILGEAASSLGRSLSSPDAFSDFAASYGVELTPGAVGRADLEAAFPFGAPLADLSAALAADDLPAVGESVARFVAALQASSRRSMTSLPFPLNGGWFWTGVIGRGLIDGLLDALVDEHPSALPWLELGGLAEVADVSVKNRDGSDSDQWRGRAVRARLDRLPLLLRPEELLRQVYGWGGEFDHLTAALRIARVLEGFGGSMVPLSALVSGPAGDALRRSLPGEQDPLIVGFGPEIVGPNPRAGEGPSEPAVIAVLPGALGMVLSGLPANERGGDAGLGVRLYLGGEAADPTTSPVRIQVGAVGTYGLLIRPSGVRFVASAVGSLRATIDFAQLLGRPGDGVRSIPGVSGGGNLWSTRAA